MNKNIWIGIGVIVILLILGVSFMGNDNDREQELQNENTSEETSGSIVGENAVNVEEQKTGNTVTVSSVMVEASGYVVVHENSPVGNPGKVLGSSSLLSAGQSTNVSFPLTESLKDGQKYTVMLHLDNGDGVFSEASDPAAKDSQGNPVMMEFEADADAVDAGASVTL